MLTINNPAVNLATRRFLRDLRDEKNGLDEACVGLLSLAVDRCRDVSPSGWVYLLADALGAPHLDALDHASMAELYYAMCSYTDDVQDGDASRYMQEEDPRILVNTLAQLICVTAARMAERGSCQIYQAFLAGAVMLRGQRTEILRQRWSLERWVEVARLSASTQLMVYFRLACAAAGEPPEPFKALSRPLGILLQLMHDRRSGDERLIVLSGEEVEQMESMARRDLIAAADGVPHAARPVVEMMTAVVSA